MKLIHSETINWIALPLLLLFVSGCATDPVYVYQTKELVRDRYVAVPEALTQPVEIITLSADFDVYALGAAYKAQKTRAEVCNGKLAEIAGLTRK